MERADRLGASRLSRRPRRTCSPADRLPADAVLCPSHLLGVLAERKLARSRAEASAAQRRMGRRLPVAQTPRGRLGQADDGGPVRLAGLLLLLSGRPAGEARPPSAANLGRVPGVGQAAWRPKKPASPFGRGAGGEGLVRHDRAARARLGGPGPAWLVPPPMPNIATTTRRCSTSKRWSRWWPASRSFKRWKNWSPRPNSARPIRCATIPRPFARRSGAASAAWP